MESKDNYYNALKENRGQLNEIDLGEKTGLDESETRAIIAQLLSEHRIEYVENRFCNYRISKTVRKKSR